MNFEKVSFDSEHLIPISFFAACVALGAIVAYYHHCNNVIREEIIETALKHDTDPKVAICAYTGTDSTECTLAIMKGDVK